LLITETDEEEKTGNEFARGLGEGLAHNFPSFRSRQQQEILEEAKKNKKFARGLGEGIIDSFIYVDKDIKEQILTITDIAIKPSLQKILQENDKIQFSDNDLFYSKYDDFPIVDTHSELRLWTLKDEEISFSGKRQKFCICFIDMMNSTKISAELTDTGISKYYTIFLNAMATIAKNHGAKIVKNAGDCLIYYFPNTSESSNLLAFKDVIECGITMILAHRTINAKLHEERLPSLDYRISADYGIVQVARSRSLQGDDLFGSTVNVCAKINSKAPANGMVIGNNLYQITKAFDDYVYKEVEGYGIGSYQKYSVYSITSKNKRTMLNPFKRTVE